MYDGDWLNDSKHGKGEQTWPKEKGSDTSADKYLGNWAEGQRSGFGVMTYTNGDRYEGNWGPSSTSEYGVRSGEGKCTYENKDIYEGSWEEDVRQGNGPCTMTSTACVDLDHMSCVGIVLQLVRPASKTQR